MTEEQRMNNVLFGDPEGSLSRAATNVDKIKWPNAVIPYEFDCSVGECCVDINIDQFAWNIHHYYMASNFPV